MPLNAVQNATKRRAIKHIYPLQMYKQNLFEPLKYGSKEAKHPLKSGVFGAKGGFWGFKNHEPSAKLERQNGAKRTFFS